ncbi:ABC transporter substrate binding protein [Tepidimonas ignava]|uniref:ABC transporter substrate binding protein n=1 Tax=Tepidimonas ignava TaxID=114249 RepID=UPI002FDB6F4E
MAGRAGRSSKGRRALLLGAVSAWLGESAWAQDGVWLAQSDTNAANEEAAAAVRDVLGERAAVSTALWAALQGAQPRLIVTLGVAALRGMLQRRAREPGLANVPLLAGLVPRQAVEAEVPAGTRLFAAVVLDQPTERYGELVRAALPARRQIGVLLDDPARRSAQVLQRWAAVAGRQLITQVVQEGDVAEALRRVLNQADVLLALPDVGVYRADALQNIIVGAYRRRVPVVSYAVAHARAGAVLALAALPAQAGAQVGEVARLMLSGRAPAPLTLARDFTVVVNEGVARSLDLVLPTPEEIAAAVRTAERQEGRA